MSEGRRHAAVQVLGVGEPAQRPRPPFGRAEAQRHLEGGGVLHSARFEFAARKTQIAAEVMYLGERAIVGGGASRQLGFGQRGESVIDSSEQPVGGGATDQRPQPILFSSARGQGGTEGLERALPPPRVELKTAELQGEIDAFARLGRERETPDGESDRLILSKKSVLVPRRDEIGPRRFRVFRQIEVLGRSTGSSRKISAARR